MAAETGMETAAEMETVTVVETATATATVIMAETDAETGEAGQTTQTAIPRNITLKRTINRGAWT